MMTRVGSMAIVLAAVGYACGVQDSPHEQALKQAVESLEKIGATLKTINNEESAGAAKPDLRKSAASFLDARAKADKMQPPEKAEKERLKKLYKPKLEEALQKISSESRRVEQIPGGKDALNEIKGILKKDSK